MKRFALTFTLLIVAACKPDPIQQIGYFKDEASNRVFVLQADDEIEATTARDIIAGKMHTEGQMTVVYLFTSDSAAPSDVVTLAPNFVAANQAMFDSPGPAWRWRWVKAPSGKTTFTDCETAPDDSSCK